MKPEASLSDLEKHRLHDFLYRRPQHLSTVNGAVGALAIALFAYLFPEAFPQIAVGGLGGALIGVYFEQRHILELRAIFRKVSAGAVQAGPASEAACRDEAA